MAENSSSEIVNVYQPKKRFLIPINTFHVPKKLFKLFKKNTYDFKINNDFENVIYKCQKINWRIIWCSYWWVFFWREYVQ